VVELNRAVAVSMVQGPAAAMVIVDEVTASGVMEGSHLLPTVRGELLVRMGRTDEARAELTRAAALRGNGPERSVLDRKIAALPSIPR
jgi:predicted RNA polymerase sigma factor